MNILGMTVVNAIDANEVLEDRHKGKTEKV